MKKNTENRTFQNAINQPNNTSNFAEETDNEFLVKYKLVQSTWKKLKQKSFF